MDLLRSVHVFVAVVNHNSFAEAARQMNMSPSSVSKHLAFLEQHLDSRLLHRTTRTLDLTEKGQQYYHSIRPLLSALSEVEDELKLSSTSANGTVQLNVPVSYALSHISPLLKTFYSLFPSVKISMTMNDRLVDLIDEGFDLAIRLSAEDREDPALRSKKLKSYPLMLVASPAYLERLGTPRSPEDLVNPHLKYNCLTYSQNNRVPHWTFKPTGKPTGKPTTHPTGNTSPHSHSNQDFKRKTIEIQPKGSLHANNNHILLSCALEGLGVAVLPAFLIQPEMLSQQKLTVLFPEYSLGQIAVYALYPSYRHLPAKVRFFIDFLEKNLH